MDMSVFITAIVLVFLAIVDRFIIRRQGLVFNQIEGVQHDKGRGVYSFRCSFTNKSIIKLRGAEVRYIIYDDKDPTNVIEGKKIPLNFLKKGQSNVVCFVADKYVVPGEWEFQAEMVYGNCFWNPLYRLFPYRTTLVKKFTLEKD